jgi:hypothetical protein
MQSITLNIRYDLPDESWGKIGLIYEAMEGWQGYGENGIPLWNIGAKKDISLSASVEPSGLVLEYEQSSPEVEKWISSFISKATNVLGFEVKNADA